MGEARMSKLGLWKAIWEIRYPAAAKLFDVRGDIAGRWQRDELTDWRISSNQVVIHNIPETKVKIVGIRNAIMSEEQPTSYSNFSRGAIDFSRDIVDRLQITKLDRMGLRLLFLEERKHFKQLMNRMSQRLFRLKNEDWEVFGGTLEDIGFPLTLKVGNKKANLKLGPMNKEQYRKDNVFKSDETLEDLPLVSLFVDFDLYELDPSGRAVNELIADYLTNNGPEIHRIVDQIYDHFGGFER